MEPDLAANKRLDLEEKDPLVRDRRNKRRALSCPLAREDGEEAIAAAGWQRSGRRTDRRPLLGVQQRGWKGKPRQLDERAREGLSRRT